LNRRSSIAGQPRADRLVVSLSDLEIGSGGVLDDVPDAAFVASVIRSYAAEPFLDIAVDFVFNGDTFDLLKTSIDGIYPVHITAAVAVAKLEMVLDAHVEFVEAIRDFLAAPGERRVFFIVGNHDQELLFPEVQAALQRRIGNDESVYFPGFSIGIGDALFEHGSQGDGLFRVPPETPFLSHKGERILNLPWGTVSLLHAMMPLQVHLYWADRLKPRKLVFKHIPELQEVLANAFWQYWTRDYWRNLWEGDPLLRPTWTMARELAYRFSSLDPDVEMGLVFQQHLRKDEHWRVRCVGHHHRPTWWSYGDRKLLTTGCYRNEFMVEQDGRIGVLLPKVHAEVYQRRGESVRSQLVELNGPEMPVGFVPVDLASMRASVAELLGTAAERQAAEDGRKSQEQTEGAGPKE
jgi:UDP-2,3-diacylglucosamine pyrophosphatase LpxH